VQFNALNSIQLVAGVDMHKNLPPVPPAPAPHVVAYLMGLADPDTSKQSDNVKVGWGYALGRQHDLGRGLYHFAVNALLPVVDLGAGNKAEFGCATVTIGHCGSGKDSLRIAAALIPFAGLNLQLDCDEPCPMPTSMCVASFNTVYVGMTAMDILAGFVAGAVDCFLTWLVSFVSGKIATAVLAPVLGLFGPEALLLGWLLGADTIASLPIGWLIGSPLGYSYEGNFFGLTGKHVYSAPGSKYGGKLNDWLNDHISKAPTAPKAPAPAGSPGSSTPGTPGSSP
jgi:hypothetical protein